jgi:S1-C subfamily serine protease
LSPLFLVSPELELYVSRENIVFFGPRCLLLVLSVLSQGQGILVNAVNPGSLAAKEGSVKGGDCLVHVGIHNVTFHEFSETLEILKDETRPVTLTFRRPKDGINGA